MKQNILAIVFAFFIISCSIDSKPDAGHELDAGTSNALASSKALPDLVVSPLGVTTKEVMQGENISFYHTIRNMGVEGPAGNSTFDLAIYLTKDFVLDSSDIELPGGYLVFSYHLSTGWMLTVHDTSLIPLTVPDGKYYLIAVVDVRPGLPPNYYPGVNESNENNNINFSTSEITIGDDYYIGDTGPAGGIIFYDKGNDSGGWRYLEAAPASTEWTNKQWGKHGSYFGITSAGIGSGQMNTIQIILMLSAPPSETGRAAQACDSLVCNGYSDWFLPSKDELSMMYENISDFAYAIYLSSTEYSANWVWGQDFYNGIQYCVVSKNSSYMVRAIRKF